ncbi:hypothetical protein D3C81_2059490 [compost metagenome]
MRLGQFGGNQRALEVFDLLAEVTTAGNHRMFLGMWRGFTIERQFQSEGEALRGILQFTHVAWPIVA